MVEAKLSAGVIVVRPTHTAHWQVLLLRAYQHWDFPKGMVEPGEDPFSAAIRETEEETSLTDLEFRWGHGFWETEPYNQNSKRARYYLAASLGQPVFLPVSAELGKPEHDEFRWVNFIAARDLLVPRVQAALDWAGTKLASGC